MENSDEMVPRLIGKKMQIPIKKVNNSVFEYKKRAHEQGHILEKNIKIDKIETPCSDNYLMKQMEDIVF